MQSNLMLMVSVEGFGFIACAFEGIREMVVAAVDTWSGLRLDLSQRSPEQKMR